MTERTAADDFLLASILDMQATIRAIDFKGYVVLLLLSLPFSKIETILKGIEWLWHADSPMIAYATYGLVPLAVFAWTLALGFALRCLIVVVNPADRVGRDSPTKDTSVAWGLFYAARRFDYTWSSALFSDRAVRTQTTPRNVLDEVTKGSLHEELAFEQLKIGYILARKIACTRYAMIATTACTVSGLGLWLVSLGHRYVP